MPVQGTKPLGPLVTELLTSAFHSTMHSAFPVKLFIIIDQTWTILLALAKQILTCFDIRTKNMFSTSRGAVNAGITLIVMDRLLSASQPRSL